ncbi:hypothetical protein ACHAXS_010350, partial [Conticribra weissflogii]
TPTIYPLLDFLYNTRFLFDDAVEWDVFRVARSIRGIDQLLCAHHPNDQANDAVNAPAAKDAHAEVAGCR